MGKLLERRKRSGETIRRRRRRRRRDDSNQFRSLLCLSNQFRSLLCLCLSLARAVVDPLEKQFEKSYIETTHS